MQQNAKLKTELSRILSGNDQPPVDLSEVTLPEMFKFSGLTRWAWCESLGVSDPCWGQYRSGRVKIPKSVRENAIRVSLQGAAVRLNAVDLEASRKIAAITDLAKS